MLIVFDLDGTLVDSTGDLAASVNAMLLELRPQGAPLALPQVRAFVGEGAARLVERSLACAGLNVPLELALPVFFRAYEGRLLETTRPYPGVVEGLRLLAGHRLCVLTNKPGGFSRKVLQGLALDGFFERVVGGDDAPRKPSPDGLLGLMRACGADAPVTLLVGDSPIDVSTARAAGVAVVGVSYGLDPQGLLAAGPDALLDDLRALPAYLARAAVLG